MRINVLKKNIIYFHLGGLGDTIHDLSVLSQLLENFPNDKIYYICNNVGKDILKYSFCYKKITIIVSKSLIIYSRFHLGRISLLLAVGIILKK